MKTRVLENIVLAVMLFVAVVIFYGCSIVTSFMNEALTPDVYGKLISGMLIVVIIIRLVFNTMQSIKHVPSKNLIVENKKLVFSQIALIVVYACSAMYIGYFVSSFVYSLIAFVFLCGIKEVKENKKLLVQLIVIAVGFVGVLYYLFDLVKVFLPNTPLI
jgi:hypothetical protein